MGITTKIKIGAAVLLVLAGLLAWYEIRTLKAEAALANQTAETARRDAETAQREAAAARTQTARITREFQHNYQALTAQKAEYDRHRQQTTADRAAIREVCANDKTAEILVTTVIPAALVARLCGDPGPLPLPGADLPAAPGRLPPGCAGARITVGDLIAWALDLREALRQCNSDKSALRAWATTVIDPSRHDPPAELSP